MCSLVGMSVAGWPRSDGAVMELAGTRGAGRRAVQKVLLKGQK